MIKKVLLVGNPNVGKSVVFSRLTGVRVISSNYPGTTFEIRKGFLNGEGARTEVIDLPGTYSLEPQSDAERVVLSSLQKYSKEEITVINIVDSTNLERNLYLTVQLLEEGYPLIVCLNMCDEAKHCGIDIDIVKLEEFLGVSVVLVCAVTGAGVKELIAKIGQAKPSPKKKLAHQERWIYIGRITEAAQKLVHRHHTLKERFEDASVRPLTGILMAIGIIVVSFKAVRFTGELLINKVFDPVFFNFYQPLLERLSNALGKGLLHQILLGGLIDGRIDFKHSLGLLTTAPYIEFAMVLPYLFSFYIVLGILEDTGFLPRLSMLLDNLLHRLGLHGFAIIPVLLGFGCNVPGILSTRILESRRERFIAATLISIGIPCIPLQAMIFGVLGSVSGFYVAGVYLTLFSIWIVLGTILNRVLKGYSPEFLVEIPPYRLPPAGVFLHKLFLRTKDFVIEALPVVMLGVLAVNILLLLRVFDFLTGIFSPLIKGLFGLPKEAVVALTAGLFRKDVAVGMLMPLDLTVKQLFIAVVLLSISFPCIATFVVLLKELGLRSLFKAALIMLGTALIVGGALNFGIIR